MKRILILKIGAIGDIVMAMPMLPYLKQDPNTHITWIVGKTTAPLLENTGLVNEIILVDEIALFKHGVWQRIKEILKLWKRLALESFDLVICAHADKRYRFLLLTARAKKVASLNHNGPRKKLIPGRYHAAEYMRLASGSDDARLFEPKFPTVQTPLSAHLTHSCVGEKKIIALAPGGAKNLLAENHQRRWPIENYAKAGVFFAKKNYQILILGAPEDAWVLPYFFDFPHVNLVGKTTLLELLALLKHTDLFITHDSGPMHIAKLAKCPTIALFGPTMPSSFVGREPNIHVLWGGKDLSCRPCYDGKRFTSCQKPLCMESISLEEVLKKAESLLEKKPIAEK